MLKTINHFFIILFFILYASLTSNAQSLIALVDRANTSGTTSAEGQGITVSGLSRGAGINHTSSGGDYNSTGWDNSSPSLSNAKANNDYLQFSIQVNSGSLLDLNEMKIRMDRSGTGPNNVQIEYSTNAFSSAGTSIFSMSGLSKSGSTRTIDLSSTPTLNASSTITFRIFAWGASSSSGTFDIEGFSNSYTSNGWTPTISDPGVAIKGCTTPQNPTNITNTSITNNSTTISWTNTSCFNNMVIIGGLNAITTVPSSSIDPSSWSSNTNWNNKVSVSSQLSGGAANEYVLYVGTGSSATITNLPTSGNFHYKVLNNLASWSSGGTGSSPLPVEFIDFDAERFDDYVLLTWSTASELNNNLFEIQKSTFGKKFLPIAVVSGNGTTNEIQHYSYTDYNASLSAFYRLKQIDYDGTYAYSKVVRIFNQEELISFNEDDDNVVINLEKFVPSDVYLLTSCGREIMSDHFLESYSINKSLLTSGMYVLVVRCNDQIHHYRFVK